MKTRENTSALHLPRPFLPADEYERLYAFNHRLDAIWQIDPTQEIRIQPGLTAKQVYQKLPSAPDFEYAGYLTTTRIRFAACEARKSWPPASKPCTFHTHPTGLGGEPDVPSSSDVYSFLHNRHLRTITVGKRLIWVMDKTKCTVATIRRLATWETTNMVREMLKLHEAARPAKKHLAWYDEYYNVALKALDLRWPRSTQALRDAWPDLLREHLRIKVTVFRR